MIDAQLYQDEQAEEERADEERRVKQRQNKNRIEAKLRSLDSLTDLPKLTDRDGRPVAIEGDALRWLHEQHPETAARWKKVLQMALANEVEGKQMRLVETSAEQEAAFAKRMAEQATRFKEMEKERDALRKYYATKREEGFQKVVDRREKLDHESARAAMKLLSASRENVDTKTRRTIEARQAQSEALRQSTDAAEQQARERKAVRERSAEANREQIALDSARKLAETSARRQHELEELLKSRTSDEERIKAAAEARTTLHRQQAEGTLAAVAKKDKDLQAFWKSVDEERKYTASVKQKKIDKALEKSAKQRDELIAKELALLSEQEARLDQAEQRREAYLLSVREGIREREAKLNISPRRGDMDDTADLAAALKEREARFFTPKRPPMDKQLQKTVLVQALDETSSTSPRHIHKAGFELAEERYAEQLKKLEASEKEMKAAADRRAALIEAERERKQLQHDKLEAAREKASRRAAYEQEQQEKKKKVEVASSSLPTVLKPEPEADPMEASTQKKAQPLDEQPGPKLDGVATPAQPDLAARKSTAAEVVVVVVGPTRSEPTSPAHAANPILAVAAPSPRVPQKPQLSLDQQLAAAAKRVHDAQAAAAVARAEALRLRGERDAAAAALRDEELKNRKEVAAHLGREKGYNYRDINAVLKQLDAKKQHLEESDSQRRLQLQSMGSTHATLTIEQVAAAAARRDEAERARQQALLDSMKKRDDRLVNRYALS